MPDPEATRDRGTKLFKNMTPETGPSRNQDCVSALLGDGEPQIEVYAWGIARGEAVEDEAAGIMSPTPNGILGIGDVSALPSDPEDKDKKYQATPARVQGLRGQRITQVICGDFHSLALSDQGEVFAWGSARYGTLGIGDFSRLPSDPSDELDKYQATATQVQGLDGHRITQVACGEFHTVVLSEEGIVFAWGSAQHGRLPYYHLFPPSPPHPH